jgi:ABC-2 type transport system ATP-binding protein
MTPAIEIRSLTKHFSKFHLGPLDMTVPSGAIYGLIGPNGSGKTTTFDLLMRMGPKNGGSIRVFGLDHLEEEAEVKRRIGYVSPDMKFHSWRKIGRLIGFVRGFYPDWDDAYCADLMRRFKLEMSDRIASLSFGNKIKLNLVVALSHHPDLLLLDEPTIGVDAVAKQDIYSELLKVVQQEDRTVVIASHSLSDLERFTDHLGILHEGKMLLEGPTSDLLERYRWADFEAPETFAPKTEEGFVVREKEGSRCRALLDLFTKGEDWLRGQGVSHLSLTPTTLEDLFVTLVQGGMR